MFSFCLFFISCFSYLTPLDQINEAEYKGLTLLYERASQCDFLKVCIALCSIPAALEVANLL